DAIIPPPDRPASPMAQPTGQPANLILPPGERPANLILPPGDPRAVTPTSAKEAAVSPRFEGEAQVRIVATIGTNPIYEREVREAVYQRLPEISNLPAHERKAKEKTMFKEELRKIVERELILDELFAMLNQKKQEAALTQLKDGAAKEAEARLRDIQ